LQTSGGNRRGDAYTLEGVAFIFEGHPRETDGKQVPNVVPGRGKRGAARLLGPKKVSQCLFKRGEKSRRSQDWSGEDLALFGKEICSEQEKIVRKGTSLKQQAATARDTKGKTHERPAHRRVQREG